MILFSDLHLSPRTFDTCMKVLDIVHQLAKERNTTVGFLGDFFDHVYNKGTLPVNILNSLLRYFELKWSVPMIMIPGNHDYFDASETEHGLTPFKYASKFITVVDEPTTIGRQLWIPWRRSTVDVESALVSHSEIDVVFGHFDIIGFKLSAKHISTEGVSPTVFPSNTPVYSGHYHTPQIHNNIRYLGSPYQLTLSEAEDKKAFLVVDTNNWRVVEEIPVQVGRRQYNWSPEELLARESELNPDDRVSVSVSAHHSIQSTIDSLIDRGITVDIKKAPAQIATRMEESSDYSPMELLEAYGKRQSANVDKRRSWAFMREWVVKWSNAQPFSINNIRPVRIRIEGFGPFTGPLTVALQGQGFTLVSGQQHDMPDSSNGVGKSMVTAGAWLWVCTGSIDQRGSLTFEQNAGIVHTDVGKASVCVEGSLGTSTWSIERTLTSGRKRKHTLRYFVNDVEKTRSTLSGTQRAISSELFGLDVTGSGLYDWLVQNCVWSQHSATRWIDANEAQAKTQIQPMANMDIWCAMHAQVKKNQKETDMVIMNTKLKLDQYTQKKEEAKKRFRLTTKNKTIWQCEHDRRIKKSNEDLRKTQESLESALKLCGEKVCRTEGNEFKLISLEQRIRKKRDSIVKTKMTMDQIRETIDTKWLMANAEEISVCTELSKKTIPDTKKTNLHKEHCFAALHARRAIVRDKQKQLERMKTAEICHTCKRSFERPENFKEHLMRMQEEIERAKEDLEPAEVDFIRAQDAHARAENEREDILTMQKIVKETKQFRKLTITHHTLLRESEELNTQIKSLVEVMNAEEARIRTYERTQNICDDLRSAIDIMRQNHDVLLSEQCPYCPDETELEVIQTKINQVEYNLRERHADQAMWRETLAMAGPRGIQTYAMEHTIQRLAAESTLWLQKLFHTKDIRLRVYFDEKERLLRHVEYKHCNGVMSGGQWRRVQLASFLAWREMSSSVLPLLIMDEPCTCMDEPGIRDVQQTLRDWCDADPERTCFFITHESGQHRDTSIYHNHTKILQKRGRSSIVDSPRQKRRK